MVLILRCSLRQFAVSSDPNISGLIKKIDVLQPLLNPKTFASFFRSMDTNGDGVVDWPEFRATLGDALQQDRALFLFELLDIDGPSNVCVHLILQRKCWCCCLDAHCRSMLRDPPRQATACSTRRSS